MTVKLFDERLFGDSREEALDFLGGVLASSTECAIVAGDLDGRILLWNEGARRIYGYEPEEIVGRVNCDSLLSRHDVAAGRWREILAAALDEGRWEGLLSGMRASGAEFTSRAVVTPRLSSLGRPEGFLLIAKDIADEIVAARTEAKFHGLLECSPDAMVIANYDCRIVMVNSRAGELFAYARHDMVGMPVEALVAPSFRERCIKAVVPCLGDFTSEWSNVGLEMLGQRRDGTEFPIEIRLTPRQSDEGMIVICTFRDLTEQKQLENQLRRSQQRLQHVVDSSPAVLFTVPIDGKASQPTWLSENIKEMLGYTVEEAMQPFWWQSRIHSDDRRQALLDIQEATRRDRMASEYRFVHHDGQHRWLRSEMRRIRDAQGQPVEIVGSWTDITERKHLEDQLRQSQKMEAIGRLAGGVVHDFNNLLTVITGYSEILLSGSGLDDTGRSFIEQIRKGGERAALLTSQLMSFSRKQTVNPTVLDLNALLLDMEKMFRRVIGEDIDLRLTIAPNLARIKADSGQLGQVVMNLVVNARDAMPQGGQLTIETANIEHDQAYCDLHPEATPGQFVLLTVSDTGCGMDEATRAHIFEPFFTTKGQGKGTGLGLATVYGIVAQCGGRVDVFSEPGLGAMFKIYIPIAAPESQITKSLSVHAEKLRGTETVLLVEDDEGVRNYARLILEKNGYRIIEARTGAEALRLCREHRDEIQIMVTDVVMPSMSGHQLAKHLAVLRPQIKVLYLSGYTNEAIVHHGVDDPNTPFLQKPFNAASLAGKVREVLDRS